MNLTLNGDRNRQQLWLWPGVVAVTLQWLVQFGTPVVAPEATIFAMLGGLVGALAVLVWWAFLSRVPHFERWGALVLIVVAVALTPRILHPSIVGGMMGMMFNFSVIPGLCLALVVWAVISRPLAAGPRRAALVAAILLACGFWALVRTDGITGNGHSQLAWRWTKTHEQQLLVRTGVEPVAPPVAPPAAPAAEKTPAEPGAVGSAAVASAPSGAARTAIASPKAAAPRHSTSHIDWPGFRGPHRDGTVTGVRIKTDWAASPPVELWRRPVGPGWSSFAVADGLIYTQEQRGDFEVVACYDAATGKPVWTHRDAARFWESNGGAGPRGTPTLHDGRLYTFGATAIVNALDAGNGAVVWTRNAASDTGAQLPGWGFASSPLVVDDLVIVAASGRLVAYDLSTGVPRWFGPHAGGSYSSPQLLTIGGVAQVVLLSGDGATSVAPADGKVLWKHSWPGASILQPAVTADGGVLVTTNDMGGGIGVRRLAVARGPGGWTVEEVWTSVGLKPYFNDFVVHEGLAFGLDGSILACIDLQDGKRKWKGGRYGHGQLLLLADQDLLLVLSEEGQLALVAAVAGQFTEIARFPAMDDKTWNHPVLAGDILLVRNGQEMVAFRLSLAGV
ncbi:MAG TPA: PQQ-binding-like beta-propeller repeat protein [Candidatus Acidoferrales bacterium]|nr:PQQ-binding-like beta-propeller repeat protein [Candidatus Acidoferrales bacterium]